MMTHDNPNRKSIERENFEEAMKAIFKAPKIKAPKGRKVEKQQKNASSQPKRADKD
jgi:hypothetical protein